MNNICIDSKKDVLKIDMDTIITESNDVNEYLEINIANNVKVIINILINIDKDRVIIINQQNNSQCFLNFAGKVRKNNKIEIINNINGDNNQTNMNIFLSLYEDNITKVTLNVLANTINNDISENVKVLNLHNNSSTVLPIMNVDTNSVIANHSCTISNIDENYLFYLNSQGITEKCAINMLEESFLKSIFEN